MKKLLLTAAAALIAPAVASADTPQILTLDLTAEVVLSCTGSFGDTFGAGIDTATAEFLMVRGPTGDPTDPATFTSDAGHSKISFQCSTDEAVVTFTSANDGVLTAGTAADIPYTLEVSGAGALAATQLTTPEVVEITSGALAGVELDLELVATRDRYEEGTYEDSIEISIAAF